MTAPTPREIADHIGEANGMVGHEELARLAEAAISSGVGGRLPTTSIELSAFIAAANPTRVLALLSEIAALRGQYELDGFTLQASVDRATQAERQRDELRKALDPFAEAAESLDDETRDHDHIWEQPAAMSIDAGHLRTARALLANQGSDQ